MLCEPLIMECRSFCLHPLALSLTGVAWIVLGSVFYYDQCDQYSPPPGIGPWLLVNGANNILFAILVVILNKIDILAIWKIVSVCLLTLMALFMTAWTLLGTVLLVMDIDYPCDDVSPLVISLVIAVASNYLTTFLAIRMLLEEGETVNVSVDPYRIT